MPRRNDLRMRLAAITLPAVLASVVSWAQVPATEPAPPSPTGPGETRARSPYGVGSDPVLGSVDGKLIYLSDVTRAAGTLREELRNLPFEAIMPALLDRMIDHAALALRARRAGLDRKPEVQRDMRAAVDRVLESAWLGQVVPGQVTEEAIVARFKQQYANRPASDEVRARHILVGSEAEANTVLDELRKGADFATVARVASKDPDGEEGGELGFFRRDQVWAGFADLAFSLQPGQIGPVPIHNEFGWHIVQVEERRLVAPPTLSEAHEQIRDDLIAQAVEAAIAEARSEMIIHKFNLDGSDVDADPPAPHGGPDRSH